MRTVVFITLILFNSLLLAQEKADLYVVKSHGGRSAIFSIGNNSIITELTDSIRWASVIDSTSILVRREHSYELWEPDFNHCLISNATDYMHDWYYGLIMFKKDGYWRYYGHNGSLKFNRYFEEVSSYVDGFAYVKIKGKYGYIDTGGRDVKSVPKAVSEHFKKWGNEELTAVADIPRFRTAGYTMFSKGNLYGIKDANSGEIVLDAEYESIYKSQNDLVIVRKNGNYGLYNYVQKTFMLDCMYEYITLINKE